jgi:ketosteroid isomerase-like protein
MAWLTEQLLLLSARRKRNMKRTLLAFIAVAVLFAVASTARSAAPSPDNKVAATIEQLEHEWTTAIVNRDFATLDRLLANDFNGTSPTAHTYPKSHALADLKSGRYVVEKMDLDEVSVNVYGDAAVAFTSQEEKSVYDGKDISGHYHYTDVWIKRNGRWQVVASHGSRFETSH